MVVDVASIKALREKTSAGVMDCKRALEEAEGDLGRAVEILRKRGIASASKKASRVTNEGLIETYVHSGGRIGALVEVNCETDFVARTQEFVSLAHDVAMQVAAMAPLYIDANDLPDGDGDDPTGVCLMQQLFIKDTSKTIQDLVNETVAKLGENIRIRKFARFALGE